MSWILTPSWIKKTFPQLVWELTTVEKNIYLTFDDGPTPETTPQVLAFLNQYKAKATFFCLGSETEKYPNLLELIKSEGHTIGNHGYRHLNGFFSSTKKYIKNARDGALITESKLFRPPYGKITPLQMHLLKKEFRIIMWSIMSMDFNTKIKAEQCLRNVIDNIFPGAIIVFHDTEKAAKNLLTVLPLFLNYLTDKEYKPLSIGCA